MKKSILVMVVIILSVGNVALADIITAPLPELVGSVVQYSDMSGVDVDLGVTFSAIQSVRIQLSGTITPGLGCGDGVERPVLPYFDVPGVIEIFFDHPAAGSCITSAGPFDGSFSVDQVFDCTYDASWDILLDGQQELFAYITSNLIVIGGQILDFPTADISQATLIVEGEVVPEPCSLVLLSLGGLMLHRKYRR